jgi:hypothetical protein
MIEYVKDKDVLMAIIIKPGYSKEGIEFFTPHDFSQQLGYMKHPKGHIINPHFHNPLPREVFNTQEVLFIKSGRVRVDFYDNNNEYLDDHVLETGDIILLAFGGHGFEMLEQSEIIEVKQGPYNENEKLHFEGVGSKINKIEGRNE